MAKRTADLAGSTAQEIELTRQTAEDVRRQTAATEAQVGVGQATLAATFRPVLVSVPQGWDGFGRAGPETIRYLNGPEVQIAQQDRWLVNVTESPKHLHFSVPVRNVGDGVAFVVTTALRWTADDAATGMPTNAIVPRGEATRISFSIPKNGNQGAVSLLQYGNFSAEVIYGDLGGHLWSTRLDVYRRADGYGWFVTQVFVKASGADDADAVGSGSMYEMAPPSPSWRPA